MKQKSIRFGTGFHISLDHYSSQVAEMTLLPGEVEGGPGNCHRGSDQWLYVVAGSGFASVAGRRVPLKAGMLVLIGRGEEHEIRNTGRAPLKTLNLYVPPAYTSDGDLLPPGKP
jgi:mannose-6-phosphate isomerase-like protein (cupin superfamily)